MSGWGSIYTTTQAALREHTSQLAQLYATASSGSRLRRASDAPTEAFRLLGLRSDGAAMDTYALNLGRVSDSLAVASSVLEQVSQITARLRELVAQGTSGTYSAGNRHPIGHEINSLLEQVVALANTRHGGRYLFGGSDTQTAPYTTAQENGKIVHVSYAGGRQSFDVPVAPGVAYAPLLVGDTVFRRDDREVPEFLGQTGAAAGAGTSTVRGDVWLRLEHLSTTYGGAGGVTAGAGSATGDTILGSGHTLTIDAPNHTLRLDDGPAVTFADGDTNVRVTNAAGDRVYVNVAGIDPLFTGTVSIQAAGRVSLDNGATWTDLDFADANLALTGADGRILYLDATGIVRTGVEPVRVPGTYDLFNIMVTLRDLMLNTRDLSEAQQVELLTQASGTLSDVAEHIALAQTSVGSGLGVLDTLNDSLEALQNHTDDQIAILENADLVQVATELARRESLYEMTLSSASRLLRLSIFDYL